ncbi:putative trehalose-phosphatase [Cucumispora dikerogammari]|nr:putative trehalose-phosphatase [Cucumispora dikerogammari]
MPESLEDSKHKIKEILFRNEKPLLVFDYDGTLNIMTKDSALIKPTEKIIEIIKKLSKVADVIVATGRVQEEIDAFFPDKKIELYSEHGAHRRLNGKWELEETDIIKKWVETVSQLIKSTKNVSLEVKKASVVVHIPTIYNKDISNKLKDLLEDEKVEIMEGKSVIDVRCRKNNKGLVLLNNIDRMTLLCAGDDTTDEDMFEKCLNKPNWFSIRITEGKTAAKYWCPSFGEFTSFLEFLVE